MTTRMHGVLAVAIIAVAVAMAPSAGEAAWWPWSKKKETAPPPAAPPTDIAPPAAGDGFSGQGTPGDRIARIEAQMRTLTGQVEQLTYQVQQLQDQLQRAHEDSDQAGKGAAKRLPAPAASAAPAGKPQPDAIGRAAGEGAAPAGPGAPAHALGALPAAAPSAEEQPIDLAAVPRATPAPGHRRHVRLVRRLRSRAPTTSLPPSAIRAPTTSRPIPSSWPGTMTGLRPVSGNSWRRTPMTSTPPTRNIGWAKACSRAENIGKPRTSF